MSNWKIPKWLENEVKKRDTHCIYCGVKMIDIVPTHGPKKSAASWEYIINDETNITRENVARCCIECNTSKGTKKLSEWINSKYCKQKKITAESVAHIVKVALKKGV